jgi:hypothetical protein
MRSRKRMRVMFFCNQIYQYILSAKRTVFLDAYDLYVLETYDYAYDACYACVNF